MKIAIFIILGLFLLTNIIFVGYLKPSSINAHIFFSLFLSLPYILLALLTAFWVKTKLDLLVIYAVLGAVGLFGIWAVINISFINPDPQGAISLAFVSVMQSIAVLVLIPVVKMISLKLMSKK